MVQNNAQERVEKGYNPSLYSFINFRQKIDKILDLGSLKLN